MTDLPRFTSGSVGPITHAQMNEVMRRLDAVRPLIESASVIQADLKKKQLGVRLVYAKRTNPVEFPDRYSWRDVIVRSKDKDNQTESVVHFQEDDWDEIEDEVATRGGSVLDNDGEESDDYAISVTPFTEGFAFCFLSRAVDGTRRYLLVPLVSGSSDTGGDVRDLWYLQAVVGESTVPIDGSPSSCFIYTAKSLTPTLAGNQVVFAKGTETILFYDLGPANPNIPSVSTGAILTPVPLQAGTVFRGTVNQLPSGESIGYVALPPRLDVECA